jgi:hypothetical protein
MDDGAQSPHRRCCGMLNLDGVDLCSGAGFFIFSLGSTSSNALETLSVFFLYVFS